MKPLALLSLLLLLLALPARAAAPTPDEAFAALAASFLDEYPALSPVLATRLGDHRFDGELDEISPAARDRERKFLLATLERLGAIPRDGLSRANRVDAALLEHELRSQIWRLDELEEWAWNPLVYTGLSGGAIYGLLAREFAPLEERLLHAAARLEQMPRLFAQVRGTLQPARVPKIHAETAVRQNRGLLSILDGMVVPRLDALPERSRATVEAAIAVARGAVDEHQAWLEETLLPKASGEFRIGAERFDRKLAFALHTPLDRKEIRRRAEAEFRRVRGEMYEVSKTVYLERYPHTEFPENPDEAYRQAIVRAALEVAYEKLPARDAIVETAERMVEEATRFVKEKDLVEVPEAPLELIVMPEFQRGVAIAYCDSPGPLDAGQKTFYAVAPLPEEWTDEQVRSFLREYNIYSLHDLTIHEAVPGHFLQIAHSNRYPSTLRAVLSSGPFVEGWAVYAEKIMVDAGYLGGDSLMKLINLKWYLRVVTNAIIDQAIHVDGMTEDEAMRLMIEGAFQEEREAAGKWVRAQLTSTQLSTYFVGYQEHADLRREYEKRAGDGFEARAYHDLVLSYGSPPVQFVRALVLELPVPR